MQKRTTHSIENAQRKYHIMSNTGPNKKLSIILKI